MMTVLDAPTRVATPHRPYRVGIIGLGIHGLAFIRHIVTQPGWTIAAGIDPSAISFARFQAEFHARHIPCFKSLYDLDDLNDMDVMFIATTAPEHVSMTKRLLDLGFRKSILVEKPISTSIVEARSLQQTIRDSNWRGKIGVDFNRRYAPIYSRVKAIVTSSELGRLVHVQYNRKCKLSMKGSHYIDLATWFIASKPVAVSAQLEKESVIDTRGAYYFDPEGVLAVRFDNGITFELDATGTNTKFPEGMTLRFENGDAHVSMDESRLTQTQKGDAAQVLATSEASPYAWIETTVQAMADAVPDNMPCTLDEAITGLEILTAAYHSSAANGATIPLPLTREQTQLGLRIA